MHPHGACGLRQWGGACGFRTHSSEAVHLCGYAVAPSHASDATTMRAEHACVPCMPVCNGDPPLLSFPQVGACRLQAEGFRSAPNTPQVKSVR